MAKRSKQNVRVWRTSIGLFVLFLIVFIALYIGIPTFNSERYENTANLAAVPVVPVIPAIPVRQATHVSTPTAVKGIYMTSCVAGNKALRNNLIKLIDETELNTIVLDVKSYDGHLSFMPKSDDLKFAAKGGSCFVNDMQDLIDILHEHGIYVISRIATFQDQLMVKQKPEWAVKKASATSTIWTDYKGISWIDASTKDFWKYIVSVAREVHDIGVDEINFDYVRFPADGNMKDISYPISGTRKKSDVMRDFYTYLHEQLAPEGITISADLFGMTTTNEDDLNIGQILENALPNFDYIAPMVYPSHYPTGFYNITDPNKHVYEVVKISMDKAVARTIATTTTVVLLDARIGTSTPAIYSKPSFDKNKMRPWLQDNNYPVTYTAEMVRAQIQAAYDSGLNSWMLWNAGNRYTREALDKAL